MITDQYYLGLVVGAASWAVGRALGRRYVDPFCDRMLLRFRAWNAYRGWASRDH